MNNRKLPVLLLFLSLVVGGCVAERDKSEGQEFLPSDSCAVGVDEQSIWNMIWPDGSPITPQRDKYPDDARPDDKKARKRINRYKEIINEDDDTLILFICSNGLESYETCGWNTRGDTLMLGDSAFMQIRPLDIAKFPIMEYVNKWNVDTIAKYWPHFIEYGMCDILYSYPDYVFRIVFDRGKAHVEGTEIGWWNDRETDRNKVLNRMWQPHPDPVELEEVTVKPKDTLITMPPLKIRKNY